MDEQGITKKQSAMIQGFAILLMLYHHFFLAPEAYGDSLSFFHIGRVSKLAWFGKICVGMFAFVSGYGMCRVLQKKKSAYKKEIGFFSLLASEYLLVLKQIFSLLIRVWLIFVVFMFFVFKTGGKVFEPTQYFRNFFFLETSYNGALWYVEQYVKMMLLLPLLDGFFTGCKRKSTAIKKWSFYGVLLVLLIAAYVIGRFFSPEVKELILTIVAALRPAFVMVFVVGFLISRFSLYEKVAKLFSFLAPWMHYITGAVLMLIVLFIRTRLAFAPAYAQTDFILVPFWVYGFLCVIRNIKPLELFFLWFGKLSTYMWLTHVFIYDYTSLWFRNHLQSHLLFYVIQVLLSMLVAMAITGLEFGIRKLLPGKKEK